MSAKDNARSPAKAPSKLTDESSLLAALAERHPAPAWAFLRHVADATGYNRRTLDAVAMSLWPSRGLSLHGFEVKSSRSDWKRELDNPAKADEMAKHLDYFWLVVSDAAMVQQGELPGPWGLVAPRIRRGSEELALVVEAKPLHETLGPVSRKFLASLMRRVQAQKTPEAELKRMTAEAHDGGYRQGVQATADDKKELEEELAKLRANVAAFEGASGVSISRAWETANVGSAVRAVMNGPQHARALLARMVSIAREVGEHAERSLATIDAVAPSGGVVNGDA